MGIHEPVPVSFVNNFKAFEHRFPTVESRHELASMLAMSDPTILPPEDREYPSRYVLAAHWGEETEALRGIAYDLYAIKGEVVVDKPAVVVRTGSLEDILSAPEEGFVPRLNEDVELEFGIVAESTLVHGFAGNPGVHGPRRMGIKPPLLGFGTSIPMLNKTTVKVDVLGELEVVPPRGDEMMPVPVYSGTVGLDASIESYGDARATTRREFLVGGREVGSLALSLAEKTDSDALLAALSELAISA